MTIKKYIFRVLAVVAAVTTLVSCEYEEGDYDKPEPTKRGLRMQMYVSSNVNTLGYYAAIAFQFNEYLAQTTEEGRKKIHDKYLYSWRIFDEDGVWELIGGGYLTITIDNDILLGQPGAGWTMHINSSYPYAPIGTATFSTEGGQVRCEFSCQDSMTTASWLLSAEQIAAATVLTISGSGEQEDYAVKVSYDITSPLKWAAGSSQVSTGAVSMTAEEGYPGYPKVNDTAAAEFISSSKVKVTYKKFIQTWALRNGSYWEVVK